MKIQIKIENLKYQSEPQKDNTHTNDGYQVLFCIYILSKIPIFKFKLTKAKFKKINQKTHIKEKMIKQMQTQNVIRLSEKYNITKDLKEIVKNIKLETYKLNLKIQLGTENVILTSFLIPAISTILTFFIYKTKNKSSEQYFQVMPIYQSKNLINFQLEGIFQIKVIHIITTICILKKKRRVEKYERTSNRRSYDYSYE